MREALCVVALLGLIAAGCGRTGEEAAGCDGKPIARGESVV